MSYSAIVLKDYLFSWAFSQAPLQGSVASLAQCPVGHAGGVGDVLVGDEGGDPALPCSVCPSMLFSVKLVGSRDRRWLKSSRRFDRCMVKKTESTVLDKRRTSQSVKKCRSCRLPFIPFYVSFYAFFYTSFYTSFLNERNHYFCFIHPLLCTYFCLLLFLSTFFFFTCD